MLLRASPTGEIVQGSAPGDLLIWNAALGEWFPGPAAGGLKFVQLRTTNAVFVPESGRFIPYDPPQVDTGGCGVWNVDGTWTLDAGVYLISSFFRSDDAADCNIAIRRGGNEQIGGASFSPLAPFPTYEPGGASTSGPFVAFGGEVIQTWCYIRADGTSQYATCLILRVGDGPPS